MSMMQTPQEESIGVDGDLIVRASHNMCTNMLRDEAGQCDATQSETGLIRPMA